MKKSEAVVRLEALNIAIGEFKKHIPFGCAVVIATGTGEYGEMHTNLSHKETIEFLEEAVIELKKKLGGN